MAFGWSASDVLALGQMAFKVVQSSRKACGEYDELTREVTALHAVLQRLEVEISKPNSPINRQDDANSIELQDIAKDCRKVLRILDIILDKYNALDEDQRRGRRLWQKIKFGNGEMNDLADIRLKVVFYTSAMTFYLNLVNVGTLGRMEEQMNVTGGVVKEIQVAVNQITIQAISKNNHEGSILTTYSSDDKTVWKEFRRELIQSGFSSSELQRHKNIIQAYVKELGSRGILDEQIAETSEDANGPIESEVAMDSIRDVSENEEIKKSSLNAIDDQEGEREANDEEEVNDNDDDFYWAPRMRKEKTSDKYADGTNHLDYKSTPPDHKTSKPSFPQSTRYGVKEATSEAVSDRKHPMSSPTHHESSSEPVLKHPGKRRAKEMPADKMRCDEPIRSKFSLPMIVTRSDGKIVGFGVSEAKCVTIMKMKVEEIIGRKLSEEDWGMLTREAFEIVDWEWSAKDWEILMKIIEDTPGEEPLGGDWERVMKSLPRAVRENLYKGGIAEILQMYLNKRN